MTTPTPRKRGPNRATTLGNAMALTRRASPAHLRTIATGDYATALRKSSGEVALARESLHDARVDQRTVQALVAILEAEGDRKLPPELRAILDDAIEQRAKGTELPPPHEAS